MSPRRALSLLFVLLVLVGCAGGSLSPRGGRNGGSRASLVVVITVDQLGSDYLDRYGAEMSAGLRRLLDESAVWPRAVHDHAITETAPGHASILSGRFPVHTGISSNSQGVNTADAPLLGSTDIGASPFRFRGSAFYDWLKATDPSTRALSVSRKDRGAILPIGRAKTEVYWYASNGTFTTSTYYREALPGWVTEFNARRGAQALAASRWELMRSEDRYAAADSIPRENDGIDIAFPHRLPTDPTEAARQLKEYPAMDSLTLALALEGVNALALGASQRRTDLLAVSLSATDAVGHRYGPDSREIHDQLLQLDRYLGQFLDSLFTMRDSRRVIVVLTADHGVAPYPDLRSGYYDNMLAQRVDPRRAMFWTKQRLHADGIDSSAVTFDDGFRVVNPQAFTANGKDPDVYAALWAEDLRRYNGVLRADVVSELAKADTVEDDIARRWLHMFAPGDAVRAVVTLTPFSYPLGVDYATHGTPHDYDARVPILIWGQGIPAGLRPGGARVVDIAPTLAEWIRIRPLERLDGRPLPLAP